MQRSRVRGAFLPVTPAKSLVRHSLEDGSSCSPIRHSLAGGNPSAKVPVVGQPWPDCLLEHQLAVFVLQQPQMVHVVSEDKLKF
jgi:hypothetical protein